MKKVFALLAIVGFILCGSLGYYLFLPLQSSAATTDIYVPRGASVAKAAAVVEQSKLVRFPSLFRLILKLSCRIGNGTIYSGAYRFSSSHTHLQLLRALLSGKQALKVRVTFPEGISAPRFASLLQKNVGVDSASFMKLMRSDSLISALGVQANSLEGYLMPDTYEYYWKQPAADIIEALVSRQTRIWQERFESLALQQGKTRKEVLTLASIVEAETPQADERPRVAGVYLNRLAKGMRLEADPTVQFALGESRRVLLSDLEVQSPYNTYLHNGLPPGPINSPSVQSIEAALNAEEHGYYFFCAKGDGSNRHSFAASSAEHAVNVLRYRRNRRMAKE